MSGRFGLLSPSGERRIPATFTSGGGTAARATGLGGGSRSSEGRFTPRADHLPQGFVMYGGLGRPESVDGAIRGGQDVGRARRRGAGWHGAVGGSFGRGTTGSPPLTGETAQRRRGGEGAAVPARCAPLSGPPASPYGRPSASVPGPSPGTPASPPRPALSAGRTGSEARTGDRRRPLHASRGRDRRLACTAVHGTRELAHGTFRTPFPACVVAVRGGAVPARTVPAPSSAGSGRPAVRTTTVAEHLVVDDST